MRLICPNCDAQYEVPDDVIPAGGRDVQCSNCDTTWFFTPPVAETERPRETPSPGDRLAERLLAAKAAAEETPEPSPPAPEPVAPPTEEIDPPAPVDELPRPRRQIDPEVLNVLREEAEFEARAREAERKARAPQTDAVVTPLHPETAEQASEGATEEPVAEPAPEPVHQEETRAPRESERPEVAPSRHNPNDPDPRTRWGFLLVLGFVGLGLAAYVYAPALSDALPTLAEPLDSYVAAVDVGRTWLDALALNILAWIRDVLIAA